MVSSYWVCFGVFVSSRSRTCEFWGPFWGYLWAFWVFRGVLGGFVGSSLSSLWVPFLFGFVLGFFVSGSSYSARFWVSIGTTIWWPFWDHLFGVILGPPFWVHFVQFWVHLGRFCVILGQVCVILGHFGSPLGPPFDSHFGTTIVGPFCGILCHFGSSLYILGHLGSFCVSIGTTI